jgi:large subunit ribosomal protein L25
MVVDEQVDPIRGSWLHADLKRIDLTKRLNVTVPVHTHGEPKGVKVQGGLLEIVTRSVEIECLPDEIPATFDVDVTELLIGQSKRAGDLGISGSMKLISPADQVIAHIVSLRAEEAPAAEAAAPATAEPEVVKKGKKDEEAADDKDKGKKK